MNGMALQVRGREYGCFSALLPTPMRVAMMVGTHNTVDVTIECQVHMGGCFGFSGSVVVGTYKILLVCEEPYPVYQVW